MQEIIIKVIWLGVIAHFIQLAFGLRQIIKNWRQIFPKNNG